MSVRRVSQEDINNISIDHPFEQSILEFSTRISEFLEELELDFEVRVLRGFVPGLRPLSLSSFVVIIKRGKKRFDITFAYDHISNKGNRKGLPSSYVGSIYLEDSYNKQILLKSFDNSISCRYNISKESFLNKIETYILWLCNQPF